LACFKQLNKNLFQLHGGFKMAKKRAKKKVTKEKATKKKPAKKKK